MPSSKRKLLGCIALLFITFSVMAQKLNSNVHKAWDPDSPLAWSDFQGQPDSLILRGSGHSDAVIQTMILVDYCCEQNGKSEICFQPAIHKINSWSVSVSPSLLTHEQLHFDITELITRKIRKVISENTTASLEEKYLIFQLNAREFGRMQIRYDRQTDHGTRPLKQQKWEAMIKKELEELKAFAKRTDCH